MPYAAFASNFLWVMVIGLLGPSVPGIVQDLGISYPQAGLFFTLLSLGSVFGTSLGAAGSDYLNRKLLYAGFSGLLAAGLAVTGFVPTYIVMCVVIFLFSLFGSPIGAIGQSIMVDMFPENRTRNISIQTVFASLGSFAAPLLVSLNYTVGLSWRWPFVQTAALALVLMTVLFLIKIPVSSASTSPKVPLKTILRNPNIVLAAVLIFFSVATDLGFSYWLAEYFKTELMVDIRLASAVVSIYLVGLIVGRISIGRLIRRLPSKAILSAGPVVSFACLLVFVLSPVIWVKVIFVSLYGLGVAPVFPLIMAKGSEEYPKQPGTVTGLLFACMSLGGMVFPLLLGVLASHFGIGRSFYFGFFVLAVLFIGLRVWVRMRKKISG